MKKKIYLIHHSHTDIGYTHPQEIIKIYHQDFIDQAIKLFEESDNADFRWTCENFWQVENYFESASTEQKEQLIDLMKRGKIDFSLNYLNMTELIDMNIYEEKIRKAKNFSDQYELGFDTAMSADINGYSQLFIEKLAKNGVKNNIACVHTHHGAHAFGKKPYLFDWKTKHGTVRTFLASHYNQGNELFVMPNAGSTHLLDDNIYTFGDENSDLHITREMVLKYLKDIQVTEGYPYDFVPVMVSGVISDNGMPNADICNLIKRWNLMYDDIELKLVTLDQFFKELDTYDLTLPIHVGDMNDWWADGVGSTPKGTKIFKSAQRKYSMLKKMNSQYENEEVINNILMYAEHTWGHSASISNPYNTLVDEMMLKKQNYAIEAHNKINRDIERYLMGKDKVTILPNRDKFFRITNVLNQEIETTGKITLEYWELLDGRHVNAVIDKIIVVDENADTYPCQVSQSARGHEIEFEIKLEPNQSKLVKVTTDDSIPYMYNNEVCDRVNDFKNKRVERFASNTYETEHFILSIDKNCNKISLFDKQINQYLSDSDDFLKLITTSVEIGDPCSTRREMGRNRISSMGSHHRVTAIKFEYLKIGKVYSIIRIHQEHEKMLQSYVDVKIYNNIKRIEFDVNYLKHVSTDVENILFNFNITNPEASSLTLAKSGDVLDPKTDLLPEANNMFFICGEKVETNNYKVLSPDCALVSFDNGEYHEVDLHKEVDKSKLCFWLANNFWETNFYTDISGYYNFRFVLTGSTPSQHEQFEYENPLVYSSKDTFKENNVR